MINIFDVIEKSEIKKYDDKEYENIIYSIINNDFNFKLNNIYYRKLLLSEYYNLPIKIFNDIEKLTQENRRIKCNEIKINGYFFRTLVDYNRYKQAFLIFRYINNEIENFNKLNILDFGCMVSDYGYFFGKLGSNIRLCDIKNHVDFAQWRLNRSFIKNEIFYAPSNYNEVTKNIDIAIFSEVLEHLFDPYDLLKACADNNVKYIYTTCYPEGDDAYFALNGHRQAAKEQVPACKKLLNENYSLIYRGLWKKLV